MGHVMVHLAVYPYLKDTFDRFSYIGSRGGLEKAHVEKIFDYHEIEAVKFDRVYLFKNIDLPFRLSGAVKSAGAILKEVRPDVVFCGGGFVCVPVSVAAKKLGIPVILHESDLSVGLANRISLRYSKKLITTFPQTLENHKKTVWCGPPIRRGLLSADRAASLKKFGIDGEKPVLLIVGGSKGSAKINEIVLNSLDELLLKYQVLHICGSGHTTKIDKKGYRAFAYVSDMAGAYAATDLAVSRCGSNTAFELVAANIPTLFIPLSKRASRGDQIENARFFEKQFLAKVLYEEDAEKGAFLSAVADLARSGKRLKANMKNFPIGSASEKIAAILKKYAAD